MRRRWLRRAGTLLIVLGVLGSAWVVVVWQWQEPFTALYTLYRQHQLSGQYDSRAAAWRRGEQARRHSVSLLGVRSQLRLEAARYRRATHRGDAIGRIAVPRLGLDMTLVDGTDEGSLQRGPGRDLRSYMPGEGRLVYIAGHRTTFLAPFSHIDQLRRGDAVTIEVPYATVRYRVTRHRIVQADDLSPLRSPDHEVLILQACHPRFFATQRYLAYALPLSVSFAGRSYPYRLLETSKGGSLQGSLRALRRRASASARS